MATHHCQHVHDKIMSLLHYLVCTLSILSVSLQAIEIVHDEHLGALTSKNQTKYLNHTARLGVVRCISRGWYLRDLNISHFESSSKTPSMANKFTEGILYRLFEKYGQNRGEISVEGLENMLTNLRLIGHGNICEDLSNVTKQKTEPSYGNFANSNDRKRSDDDRWTDRARRRHHRRFSGRSVEDLAAKYAVDSALQSASEAGDYRNSEDVGTDWNLDDSAKCLDAQLLLRVHGFNSGPLKTDDFFAICPSIIFLLDAADCSGRMPEKIVRRPARALRSDKDCIQLGCGPSLSHNHDGDAGHVDSTNGTVAQKWHMSAGSVWGYAIAACTVISAVGLVAVAIIPLMHRVIYNHLLQFLVALAIGSLIGDALLHLLPHALVPHNHKKITSRHNETESLHHGSHDDAEEMEPNVIWLGLMSVGGIFLFFIVERLVGLYSEWRRIHKDQKPKPNPLVCSAEVPTGAIANPQSDEMRRVGMKLAQNVDMQSCEEKLMMVHSSKDVQKMANEAHEELHRNCDPGTGEDLSSWDHSRNTRGHQHSHSIPGSVASVAWMVIIGDGFHNFADGIAVGSAFASSFSDGLSTSVAVFCHELPHELGDFAMLLNAGMSAKQALIYNCVSSILCFFGMACGIAVGNIAASSQWIFALIAGMFLYIALVDMLPEMKSIDPKKGEHPLIHLGLQSAGMLLGTGVMVIIAVFEGRILLG